MSAGGANSDGLTAVSLQELERLRDALGSGSISAPVSEAALLAEGMSQAAAAASVLQSFAADALLVLLEAVIAERRSRQSKIDLVWTGPESRVSGARDTAVTLTNLFRQVQHTVLIAGYSFDHGKEILAPLHQAMIERNVKVSMFVDVGRNRRRADDDTHAALTIDDLLAKNWPFGDPRPDVYYDPRTATSDSLASLHAKCAVVDNRYSLVTSANFTDRGHTRNIETGALIDDVTFAGQLSQQWWGLVSSNLLSSYIPTVEKVAT